MVVGRGSPVQSAIVAEMKWEPGGNPVICRASKEGVSQYSCRGTRIVEGAHVGLLSTAISSRGFDGRCGCI